MRDTKRDTLVDRANALEEARLERVRQKREEEEEKDRFDEEVAKAIQQSLQAVSPKPKRSSGLGSRVCSPGLGGLGFSGTPS